MTGRVPTIDGESWDGLAVGSMSSIVPREHKGQNGLMEIVRTQTRPGA
jgi:hypothetical protein